MQHSARPDGNCSPQKATESGAAQLCFSAPCTHTQDGECHACSFSGAQKPDAAPIFRAPYRLHRELLFFLCFFCLGLLLAAFWLSTYLLQPYYNATIENDLNTQLTKLIRLIDDAQDAGVDICITDGDTVTVSETFKATLNNAILDGTLDLTNLCVEISDETLTTLMYSENVHPCLLHSTSSSFDASVGQGYVDSVSLQFFRAQCFLTGTLDETLYSGELEQRILGQTSASGTYVVLVSASLTQVTTAALVLQDLLPTVALVVLLLAFVASLLFSRWFTQPIHQLSSATHALAHGNFNFSLSLARKDELGTLCSDFTHMAQKLERSSQLQQELLANVSHDLRTPLTLMKGYAETVRDLTGDDKTRRDAQLDIIIHETDRLSTLVDSILEYSKLSSGAVQPSPLAFDLRQLCEEVALCYDVSRTKTGATLLLQLPSDARALTIYADPHLLERALHNLLGNALQHVGEDGIFVLRVEIVPEGYRVSVEDHGEGIPPEDLPHLFERYYRSRTRAAGTGTGLGLSISKAIFEQHGYPFGVQSTQGEGATFWFVAAPWGDTPVREAE